MVEFQFGLFNNADYSMINSISDAIQMVTDGKGFGIGAQFHIVLAISLNRPFHLREAPLIIALCHYSTTRLEPEFAVSANEGTYHDADKESTLAPVLGMMR